VRERKREIESNFLLYISFPNKTKQNKTHIYTTHRYLMCLRKKTRRAERNTCKKIKNKKIIIMENIQKLSRREYVMFVCSLVFVV